MAAFPDILKINFMLGLAEWLFNWRSPNNNFDLSSSFPAKPLVISKFGASGDYPGCTDLAYTNAISDGVEVLDCPVQITKDGIPFCMSSINLIDSTTISQSPFINRSKTIPEISPNDAIFAFDLTWEEIQSLSRKWNWFFNFRYLFLTKDVYIFHSSAYLLVNTIGIKLDQTRIIWSWFFLTFETK